MLLFTVLGCWMGGAAILGGNLNNEFVVDSDTGWEEVPCAWVVDFSPARGAQASALSLEIQATVDGEFMGDGSIIGVETELRVDGDKVSIRPTEALQPNTIYTWWLDTGCQYMESTFVTSPYGGDLTVDPEALSTFSYDLMMVNSSAMVVPEVLDFELEELLRGWVWGRGSVDEAGDLTLAQVDAGAQDYCASTQRLQGYFSYPEPQISWTGAHIALATDLGPLDFEELRIDAVFAPDGQSLGEVVLSGLVGASQLSAHYGEDYCERVSAQEVRCVGCEDPEGCIRLRVEGVSGRLNDGTVESVDEDFCHAECSENSEECELE